MVNNNGRLRPPHILEEILHDEDRLVPDESVVTLDIRSLVPSKEKASEGLPLKKQAR